MEGYLHQIIKCAVTNVFIDKLTFVEDICFTVDVSVAVDKTETFRFLIDDRILKSNTHLYQQQFSLLLGVNKNKESRDVKVETDVVPKIECGTQTEGDDSLPDRVSGLVWSPGDHEEITIDTDITDLGLQSKNESNSDTALENDENKQSGNIHVDVILVEVGTQTETKAEYKRKPRKTQSHHKKSKSTTAAASGLKNVTVDLVPVDIKQEVDSDHDDDHHPGSSHTSDVEEVTFVPALPPGDNQAKESYQEDITCPLCPAQFKSQQGAENHLRIKHDIGNVYICKVCQEVCPSNTALHQHLEQVHTANNEVQNAKASTRKKRGRKPLVRSLQKVKAPINVKKSASHSRTVRKGKSSNVRVVLRSAKPKIKAEKGVEKCTECEKEYSSKRALTRHIKTVHEAKRYQCDVCGKCFTSKETLYHHRRGIHSESKPYQCDECGASFNFNHSLRLHRLKHSGARPYQCKECLKTYLTSNHLKMHMEGVHGGKKSHACKICGKTFSYTTSLKVHEMTHGDVRPYRCTICGQGFVNSHSLKYHKESKHALNTWFACDVCGKKYKTEFLMKTHRRRHTADGSRYMCDICGRQFMYKSTLDIHAAVHSDEKTFQCSTCGKSFKTYATLYSHQYVHKPESPFKCPDCGKAFKTKERCKAHQRRHSGLKPFECELCGRCFPDKGGLSKHTKTVHCAVKKFVCDVCGKACSRADNLRVHMKIHNKNTDGNSSTVMPRQEKRSIPLSQVTTETALERTMREAEKMVYDTHSRDLPPIPPTVSTPGSETMLTNMSSPNISPPPSMAPLSRAYHSRLDPPPFIPNAENISQMPSSLNLHVMPPMTSQESDIGSVSSNPTTMLQSNTSNPLVPSNTSPLTQMPVSASSYMYMWPYLHPPSSSQPSQDSSGSSHYY